MYVIRIHRVLKKSERKATNSKHDNPVTSGAASLQEMLRVHLLQSVSPSLLSSPLVSSLLLCQQRIWSLRNKCRGRSAMFSSSSARGKDGEKLGQIHSTPVRL